jgi:catechol 2,3-dioxygenase-like lactoylglutathione lyase family enzyme
MNNAKKARAVGVNHVALEVGDIEEALAFLRSVVRLRASREECHFGLHQFRRSIPSASKRPYPTC